MDTFENTKPTSADVGTVAGPEGVEPPTFCSVDRRSIQLSYGPKGASVYKGVYVSATKCFIHL